ncbi:NTPase [bacterium BMS3Bbin02]|nr:NTPase [bacterium BMS3Bbin02]
MTSQATKFIIEGRSGIGKTTVCRDVARQLKGSWVAATGILTSEIDDFGRRLGLHTEIIGGMSFDLAHVTNESKTRHENWGVDLEALERFAIPAIRGGRGVTIVDELGPIPLMSTPFREAVASLFLRPGLVIATAPAVFNRFTDDLAGLDGVEILPLNFHTRPTLSDELVKLVRAGLARR